MLERLDELVEGSELTAEDVDEIAASIDDAARERLEAEVE